VTGSLHIRILPPYVVLENHNGGLQGREKSLMISILIQYRHVTDMQQHNSLAMPQHRVGKQEAQLMMTTGSTRLAVSQGQQTWYHSICYI